MTQDAEGGYARPQDPWAGSYEPGVASVPTDPIPQQYAPPLSAEPSASWAPPTYEPAPSRRTGRVVGVVALLVVLAGGAGYGAYYVTSHRNGTPQGQGASNTSSGTPTSTPSPTRSKLDPHDAAVGDCVFNFSTDPKVVDMSIVACDYPKSFKIIKIVSGPSLLENAKGEFDNATGEAACADTKYRTFYAYQDNVTDTRDILFCMTNNP